MKCNRVGGGFLLGLVLMLCTARVQAGNVVINEVMYHPASGNLLESYVELLNTDTIATNLSGFKFTKGISFTFPANTTLGAGKYLVVAADRTAFMNRYPGVTNFVTGFTGSIGATLKLENATGTTINEIHYASEGDWAARTLGVAMYNHRGWEWYAPHDGLGS